MKPPKPIDGYLLGSRVNPKDLLESLTPIFPLIGKMADTPQDPEWHAEGDVFVHTEMVLTETLKLLENEAAILSEGERIALLLGAALHDVGKTLVTREQIVDGRNRIVSPHHAERGASYVFPRLPLLGLESKAAETVTALIAKHHHPNKLVTRASGRHLFARLARTVNSELIYWLELADLRGRITSSGHRAASLENLELFRIEAEATGNWSQPLLYGNWRTSLTKEIGTDALAEIDYTLGVAIRDYEEGQIQCIEEAIARTHPYRKNFATVVLTCGVSGSGKSTWISRQDGDFERISLDDLREELTGDRGDQSRNGEVLQLAKELLRACLRRRKNAIWDATSLRSDGRAIVLGLAHDYHAQSVVHAFATPPEWLFQRDRNREHAVGSRIVTDQLDRFQWPDPSEAHQVAYHWARPPGTLR